MPGDHRPGINIYVDRDGATFQGDPRSGGKKQNNLFWAKVVFILAVLAFLSYKFPVQALWIATKLFGAATAATKVAGTVAVKTAETTVKVMEETKNAAEAEWARRVIVGEALKVLTPCDFFRCTSEMDNVVDLIGKLRQAQQDAAAQNTNLCAPIAPPDDEGRLLLATAAPWLLTEPQGRVPHSECSTTRASNGDTEQTCRFETNLVPCPGAVKWKKLAAVLDEPLKIYNERQARAGIQKKEQLRRLLAAAEADGSSAVVPRSGELSALVEAVLGDDLFEPASPRRSTIKITPYKESGNVKVKDEKTIIDKMEALREDQKLLTTARFCKKGEAADSTANFCATTTKLAREKLLKAIDVIQAAQKKQLAR